MKPITIFISSPGDVKEERQIAINVINRLNSMPQIADFCMLRPLTYENGVPPIVGHTPQSSVDRYMMEAGDADIVICILWKRMGTPLIDPETGEEFQSGTEYEFSSAYNSSRKRGKPIILLYRNSSPIDFDDDDSDIDQVKLVQEFFGNFIGPQAKFQGLIQKYKDKKLFEDTLLADINRVLLDDIIPAIKQQSEEHTSKSVDSQTQSINKALNSLSQLMNTPEVREAVTVFQNDFEATSRQIELLSAYKDLHDWLHTLQFQCYEPILAEASRFPDDETARENLSDHELTLRNTVGNIESVAGKGNFAQIDTGWLLRDLNATQAVLQTALENADRSQLDKSASRLARVLTIYPAKFNTSLNGVAKTLRLPSLIKAMTVIRDKLVTLSLDENKVQRFAKGVDDLTNLNNGLSALLQEHDEWQRTDMEFRLISVKSVQFVEDLESSWPTFKQLVEPLYGRSTDKWASDLKTDSEKLESALSTQNLIRIKDCFRRYRRTASLRFYNVDVQLKFLCSNLRLVGDPLISVLTIIE